MATLRTMKTSTRRGARALLQLERRGGSVVDRKTLRAAGKIVREIRDGGDHALLKTVAQIWMVSKRTRCRNFSLLQHQSTVVRCLFAAGRLRACDQALDRRR